VALATLAPTSSELAVAWNGRDDAAQATAEPTLVPDATVSALNKQKLQEEVQQLHSQNTSWTPVLGPVATVISALAAFGVAALAILRWGRERRTEREKRDEERFQAVVTGLGSESERTRLGSAIVLRAFLQKEYAQFFERAFDLTVAHLRLTDAGAVGRFDPLRQPLIATLEQAFPLARGQLQKRLGDAYAQQSLDASFVHLDGAFLWRADLKGIYMPWACLQEADLTEADLEGAALWGATSNDPTKGNFRKVKLGGAVLRGADLGDADLSEADLTGADLREANLATGNLGVRPDAGDTDPTLRPTRLWCKLNYANLTGARLNNARLVSAAGFAAQLRVANLCGADLSGAQLRGVDLRGAHMDAETRLEGADLSGAYWNNEEVSGPIRDGKPTRIPATTWPPQGFDLQSAGVCVCNEPVESDSQPAVTHVANIPVFVEAPSGDVE
jgi:uncharacterized protein YjbI with pentapeptide repeats